MKELIEFPQVETIIAVVRRENPEFNKSPKVKQHIVPNLLEINKVDIKIAELKKLEELSTSILKLRIRKMYKKWVLMTKILGKFKG